MKKIRRVRKVTQNEDTKEVHVSDCAFFMDDIVAIEDEVGSVFTHEVPRTWICLKFDAFHAEGRFEDFYAEWVAYHSQPESNLAFSRH